MDFEFVFTPLPGQTAGDEPTEQVSFDEFTGVVMQIAAFNFEEGSVYEYRFTASDPDVDEGEQGPQPVSVVVRFEIQDVNEAPRALRSTVAFSAKEQTTLLESQSGLDMSVLFFDPDAADSMVFSLAPLRPSYNPLPFKITPAGMMSYNGAPIAFEDFNNIFGTLARVRATDSGGLRGEFSASFTLINQEYQPEFSSGNIAAQLEENVEGPVSLGVLLATDRDVSDTVTYQVVATDPAVAARFGVVRASDGSSELAYVGPGEDYEALVANGGSNIITVSVVALDGKVSASSADSIDVTLVIADVVEAPVILSVPSLGAVPATVSKNDDAGSSIVGASVSFSHQAPATVSISTICVCRHLSTSGDSDVNDQGQCKPDSCIADSGLAFEIVANADPAQTGLAQLLFSDPAAFSEGGAASFQVEGALASEDGSVSDLFRFRITVLCPASSCPVGEVPLGPCAADQPQRCVPVSGADATDEYSFRLGDDTETRDGFENGKLTLMQASGRARDDECMSTLRVSWYDGSKPAWYRALIEPYREFRVSGVRQEFSADLVLSHGQQGFIKVQALNGGDTTVMVLDVRLGDKEEVDGFGRIGGTSTVGTRCFCSTCSAPDEHKNPVCEADGYAASGLSPTDWCLKCS